MSTLALPTGRLYPTLIEYFHDKLGIDLPKLEERKYFYNNFIKDSDVNLFLAKPKSIANLVGCGYADIGVCGEDIILNSQYKNELEVIYVLGGFKVRISLCSRKTKEELFALKRPILVATEYDLIATEYFEKTGHPYYVFQTFGSTEGYVDLQDVDCIIDIVQTGKSLKSNNISELEVIAESSTVLFKRKDSNIDINFLNKNEL